MVPVEPATLPASTRRSTVRRPLFLALDVHSPDFAANTGDVLAMGLRTDIPTKPRPTPLIDCSSRLLRAMQRVR